MTELNDTVVTHKQSFQHVTNRTPTSLIFTVTSINVYIKKINIQIFPIMISFSKLNKDVTFFTVVSDS